MQPTINIDISLDKPVYNDEEKIQVSFTWLKIGSGAICDKTYGISR